MHDLTLTEIERLRAESAAGTVALEMDEEAFRGFYDRTARPLSAYLARITGDAALADDLLQEAYYRFLRARGHYETEAHRRNTLFRIATNLARDHHRRLVRWPSAPEGERDALPARGDAAGAAERSTDLRRAMAKLRPRDRAMLWLAYGQGSSHHEIAESLGLRVSSIKPLLFRARHKLAALLRGAGERSAS